MVERQSMKKTRAVDIVDGKYLPGRKEGMIPSFLITPFGEKIFRVNIVAPVTENFLSEDGNYASITLDDGTSSIRVKAFGEETENLQNIEAGDLVLVVGKIKNYNGENYIGCEIVKKIDEPNRESLWKLEVLKRLIEQKKIVDEIKKLKEQMGEEELKEYVRERYKIDEETLKTILETEKTGINYKPKILEIVEKFDEGNGTEIGKLFEFLNLDENIIESVVNDLLASGEIYEPQVGRLKKV